jgi:hypothetical protein
MVYRNQLKRKSISGGNSRTSQPHGDPQSRAKLGAEITGSAEGLSSAVATCAPVKAAAAALAGQDPSQAGPSRRFLADVKPWSSRGFSPTSSARRPTAQVAQTHGGKRLSGRCRHDVARSGNVAVILIWSSTPGKARRPLRGCHHGPRRV